MKFNNPSTHTAYFYRGTSMSNTIKNGDYLFFLKLQFSNLNCGDIIIFASQNSKEQEKQCVHRVIRKTIKILITRGDNNPENDEEPVTEENIIGRVTQYERNGKVHKVWNGRLGMMRARVLHGRIHVIRVAKFFLRNPYRMIKRTGIVAKFWRPEIEIIHFETPDGPLIKYVHEGKTVASSWTNTNHWWFRRPYDFVVGPKLKK